MYRKTSNANVLCVNREMYVSYELSCKMFGMKLTRFFHNCCMSGVQGGKVTSSSLFFSLINEKQLSMTKPQIQYYRLHYNSFRPLDSDTTEQLVSSFIHRQILKRLYYKNKTFFFIRNVETANFKYFANMFHA